MPLFLFHLRGPDGLELGEDGLDRPNLESAYLAACRAIPSMSAEFMADGRDPLAFAFEIADASGATLLEVPFDERLRHPCPPPRSDRPSLQAPMVGATAVVREGRRLVAEIHAHAAEMAADAGRTREALKESYRLLGVRWTGARR